jgi:RNA polymerase subunit RPABC4/transcription elongation factor Spt4
MEKHVCPNCGSDYEEGNRYCPSCGQRIVAEVVAAPIVIDQPAEQSHMVTDEPLRLNDTNTDEEYISAWQDRKTRIAAIVCVICIVVITVTMAVCLHNAPNNSDDSDHLYGENISITPAPHNPAPTAAQLKVDVAANTVAPMVSHPALDTLLKGQTNDGRPLLVNLSADPGEPITVTVNEGKEWDMSGASDNIKILVGSIFIAACRDDKLLKEPIEVDVKQQLIDSNGNSSVDTVFSAGLVTSQMKAINWSDDSSDLELRVLPSNYNVITNWNNIVTTSN